jgi:hypothetical protein
VGLAAVAQADQHKEAPLWLEAQLIRDFRAHSNAVRAASRSSPVWWMAAAAVVTLVIGAGIVWRHVSRRPREKRQPVAVSQYDSVAPGVPRATSVSAHRARHFRHSSRAAKITAPAREPESVSELAEFLPLPFADDDWPLGAAEVVRIRLSESALGVLGLPVSEDLSAQPVTADVVIGDDGVARAIRFVSGPVPSEVFQQLQATSFETKGAIP